VLYSQLQEMVGNLRYKPGWRFWLRAGVTSGSAGQVEGLPGVTLTSGSGYGTLLPPVFLVISAQTEDSGGRGPITVDHTFSVPPEEYPVQWHCWLLDRILDVERHETCEFFRIGDERPFYPEHGPGADLYAIRER